MKLSELQTLYAQAIIDQDVNSQVLKEIEPGGKLPSSKEAFNVYLGGYPARLTDALGEAYEGVWSVLGDDDFFTICQRFIQSHPSSSYNLSDYHPLFHLFLSQQENLCQDFPFLPELALFEWEFHNTFHKAPDISVTFSEEALSSVDDLSTFRFLPTLHLFEFKYSTYSVWKNREYNSETAVDFSNPEQLIMYKSDTHLIRTLLLQPWQAFSLKQFLSGNELGKVLSSTQEKYDLNEEKISELFSLLIGNRLITEIGRKD